ncbi:DUF4960 domain-containing protein [Aestuariibaculum suncheonense]|uniref:DUF4960 domain-containing protein n=1 Tax=Aestuariibaculum suncheonense TaxID=1028745 RepID=A0A8J6UB88_9FLAO|nr:DUF4960 domain-containing protein [Aestuariibaculum suncheonense]MBD0836098.1 DUF4960 domain-containing protein [Aestuariibaculum suncheonense]
MKNILTKNISVIVSVIALFACLIWSCEDNFDESAFVTNVSVNMESFAVNDIEGEINNQENLITVTLPYGTDISALTPELEIPNGSSILPEKGLPMDFSNTVQYRVSNGNIYKTYNVKVQTQKPISSFKINDLNASINHNSKIISLTLPEGTDLTSLEPTIEVTEGVSITPGSGAVTDFSNPVIYTVSSATLTEEYTAIVTTPVDGPVIAFLGTSASLQSITNPDEITASDWLFENYPGAQYLSFTDISNGISLAGIDVIWWHYDSAINLPTIALDASVTSALMNYQANGGNLLLTTFASQYLEALNIIPSGKGPNNVFGDFLPNGFIDGNDWGMSFVGHEDHPIFLGLETFAPGKANLLEKGTFRLNHTAWWFLPEWGGYGDGQGWRDQTGGNNLASEAWDDSLNGRVTIAEFPGGATNINTVVISMGAYDWFNENDTNGNNGFLDNIKILTANSLAYLADN